MCWQFLGSSLNDLLFHAKSDTVSQHTTEPKSICEEGPCMLVTVLLHIGDSNFRYQKLIGRGEVTNPDMLLTRQSLHLTTQLIHLMS